MSVSSVLSFSSLLVLILVAGGVVVAVTQHDVVESWCDLPRRMKLVVLNCVLFLNVEAREWWWCRCCRVVVAELLCAVDMHDSDTCREKEEEECLAVAMTARCCLPLLWLFVSIFRRVLLVVLHKYVDDIVDDIVFIMMRVCLCISFLFYPPKTHLKQNHHHNKNNDNNNNNNNKNQPLKLLN